MPALLPLLDAQTASPESQVLLKQIHASFGVTPNMFKAIAHSPAAMRSMAGSFAALAQGTLDSLLGEKIAVAVAERNGCEYCLAVHTVLGRKAGASADDMQAAQMGEAQDAKTQAALRFALKLVNERGHVAPADVQALRDVGFSDAQIVEVLAHVALNLYTNYVNVAFQVPVDFPAAPLRSKRA
ncbi:MAG: peroxidase-related enzyme [Rhizobacter sp.]